MSVETSERAVVYAANVMPDDLLADVRHAHLELLHRLLADQPGRIRDIIGSPDIQGLDEYAGLLINPNILVKRGDLRKTQLFANSLLSVMYGQEGDFLAALAVADNTSGGIVERRAKMAMPQGLHLPGPLDKLSNRKHLRLGTMVVTAAAEQQELIEVDGKIIPAAALCALYAVTKYRHSEQPVSAYVMPEDPADGLMTDVTQTLGMTVSGEERNTGHNGYIKDGIVHVMRSTVGDINSRLHEFGISMPTGAVEYRTKKTARLQQGSGTTDIPPLFLV